MKKLFSVLAIIVALDFIGCGPSQEEEAREKKKMDSIMEPERDAAIENANKLLGDSTANDSVATLKDGKTAKKK